MSALFRNIWNSARMLVFCLVVSSVSWAASPVVPGVVGNSTTVEADVNSRTAGIAKLLPGPKNLSAKASGQQILLAWEPVILPDNKQPKYSIFRSDLPLDPRVSLERWPTPINQALVTDEYFLDAPGFSTIPPVSGKKYYYAVVAGDGEKQHSAFSEIIEVINQAELSTPTNFSVSSQDQAVELSWLASFAGGEHGLAGYSLYRSSQAGDLGQPMFEKPVQIEKYIDHGTPEFPLKNGNTYYYSLFATDLSGNRSQPTEQLAATPFAAPTIPEQLTATSKTDDMIDLEWTASDPGSYAFKGYNIYRKSDIESDFAKINKQSVLETNYIDSEQNSISKPLLGRIYTYQVVGVDEKEHESVPSNSSQSATKVPLEVPGTGLLSTSIPGLPPDSSLTISGRKKIDVSYTAVTPLNTQPGGSSDRYPSLTSGLTKGFNLAQELQVRLEGKVGKKITVDVDYDDTKEEQRKISILYAGDPDEVVQEAAFGDILLDLPRTEFAGYNKNLFGAKLKVGLDNFRFTAIGAQTKGITVTEKFKGNTSRRLLDISDLNFRAFRYYYLTKAWPSQVNHPELAKYDAGQARHGIIPGTEKIYVSTGAYNSSDTQVVFMRNQTYNFNRFSSGVDYTVDYDRGIITFNNPVLSTWLIAIAYHYRDQNGVDQSVGFTPTGTFDFTPAHLVVPSDGVMSDTAHLLQDYTSSSNARDYRMMVMNRYSLDYQNIFNPQNDPDFVIKIFSEGGQEFYLPQPSDTRESEKYYRIDPTFGTIQFKHNFPFQQWQVGDTATQFSSDDFHADRIDPYNPIYNANLISGADITNSHKYHIHVEFKNVLATFQLGHWNVISNSENIKKDGNKLQRNTDYYIDYDTGFITFSNPESIAASSDISVTYEYMPFGGKYQSNLFGARGEYDIISKKLSVGSTYLYNSSQTPTDIPDIRSTPNSLSLIDADMKLTLNPQDFGEWNVPVVGKVILPLTLDVSTEGAYSMYSINTYRKSGENGLAMIDSMEGSDNVLALATDNNIWFPSSNPQEFTSATSRNCITQSDAYETGRVTDGTGNDKTHQLHWEYKNMSSSSWDGFVYKIANNSSGSNLHDYRYVEISAKWEGDPSVPMILHLDLGVVSEDSNGNGRMNFEGDAVTLGSNDDVGIANYASNTYTVPPTISEDPSGIQGIYSASYPNGYWGANNGRLNNEDLDNDGQLSIAESYYECDIVLQPGFVLYKIPVSAFAKNVRKANGGEFPASDPQLPQFMSFVKHARIWVTGQNATPGTGYIQFESIQLTGNKWIPRVADNTIQNGQLITEAPANSINATTINKKIDPSYAPFKFFYNYDETHADQELLNEQSLKLEYNIDRNAVVDAAKGNTMPAFYLTRTMAQNSNGYDYSSYEYLRVDVFKRNVTPNGEKLFIRLGMDQNNFYQYELPLEAAPIGDWYTFKVALDGSDNNRTAYFIPTTIPNISQVKEISIGILNPNSPTSTREVLWINNLRVTDGKTRQGKAFRVSSNTRWGDVFNVSTDLRDVGSEFYMIDESPGSKQHNTNQRVAGSITKLSWLPINVSWNNSMLFTELEHRDDPVYSNNYSIPDTGTEMIAGDINYNQLPGLDLSLHTSQSRRVTDYIKQIYNINQLEEIREAVPKLSYSVPTRVLNIPLGSNIFTARVGYSDSHTQFDQTAAKFLNRADKWDRWKHSRDETYTYQGNYSPIQYFQISPSFTYHQISDRGYLSWYRFYAALDPTQNSNTQYFSDLYRTSQLEKTAKINFNLLSIPVLSPSLSYTMTNTRDYVTDTLSTPGSLNLQSGISLGDLLGWSQFPKFNWSEGYTVSATYRNEYGDDPISKLTTDNLWVIKPLTFKETDLAFNSAYLNSKTINDTLSTSLNLTSDISLTPQYTSAWTKRMNSPNNFNTTETLSMGSGLVWARIPFFPRINLQSLNLDYRYSTNRNYDTQDNEISRSVTHNSTVSLPFRVLDDINSSLSLQSTYSIRFSGTDLSILVFENRYAGGLSVGYNMNMNQPIRLPNIWPFNGAILKLQQTIRLTNAFNLEYIRNTEKNITGNTKTTDMYTNDTSLNYSLWRNVEGDFTLTNQWYYDHLLANKDYWAIKLKAGLTAIF